MLILLELVSCHVILKASYVAFRCLRASYNKVCISSFSPGGAVERGMEAEMQGSGWHYICRSSTHLGAELIIWASLSFCLFNTDLITDFSSIYIYKRAKKIRNQWSWFKLYRLSLLNQLRDNFLVLEHLVSSLNKYAWEAYRNGFVDSFYRQVFLISEILYHGFCMLVVFGSEMEFWFKLFILHSRQIHCNGNILWNTKLITW